MTVDRVHWLTGRTFHAAGLYRGSHDIKVAEIIAILAALAETT